jgi:hypothetical protein
MATQAELAPRSGELQAELVGFASQPRFKQELDWLLTDHSPGIGKDQGALISFIDTLTFDYPFPDGLTVLDKFISERSDL